MEIGGPFVDCVVGSDAVDLRVGVAVTESSSELRVGVKTFVTSELFAA